MTEASGETETAANKGAGERDLLQADRFDQLLRWLHEDREEAARRYERIRQKLASFFRWRGVGPSEDLADATIDRVSQKVIEGAPRGDAEPAAFFHGVARNILREYRATEARGARALNDFAAERARRTEEAESDDRNLREARLECLDSCLTRLSAETREIIVEYYRGDRKQKIESRKAMAMRLGIPMNALWIRSHRIRSVLETCVETCMKGRWGQKGKQRPSQ